MCACELHWQDGATCTCNCPSHAADRNARSQREAAAKWRRDFDAGDVALIRVGGNEHVALRDSDGAWLIGDSLAYRVLRDSEARMPAVEVIRPLAVINPDDRDQVERLRDLINVHDLDGGTYAEVIAAALREFANPKPPTCGARLSIDYGNQGANHTCEEPEGHDGAHSDGAMSWMTGGPR